MPLMYLHFPAETFSAAAKNELAAELTTLALRVEGLPDTPFVRSTCWIYIQEYAMANVYQGGSSTETKVISLEVNAFAGGLDVAAKQLLIENLTACIHKHAAVVPDAPAPVYIIIRDVPDTNWGVSGKTIKLQDMRLPSVDVKPM
ncbi:tautomerase family protein [Mucilaginibacter sp. Bleaf8]|uniref:tautomerase family protein n=1 Tax=Mucilaginibacter sp. Bleaf8 TaxID=2834430 RepID=UPI001BCF0B26|nr:tautomerase family protein [Mucilaginibacter sp. Bleaf8]MBS7564746.1 tautomerase family protein [Mucilaginibacter sp. Bleaf8]